MRSSIALFLAGTVTLAASPAFGADRHAAVEQVKQLGGTFEVDAKADGKPIVKIDLGNTSVSDDDLKALEGLKHLRWLSLWRTRITSAGLAHLEGLSDLAWLDLGATHINDAGLKHLSGDRKSVV